MTEIVAEFIERQEIPSGKGGRAWRYYRITEYASGATRHRVSTEGEWIVAELARLADARAEDYPREEMDDDYLKLEQHFLAALDLAERLQCFIEDQATAPAARGSAEVACFP